MQPGKRGKKLGIEPVQHLKTVEQIEVGENELPSSKESFSFIKNDQFDQISFKTQVMMNKSGNNFTKSGIGKEIHFGPISYHGIPRNINSAIGDSFSIGQDGR